MPRERRGVEEWVLHGTFGDCNITWYVWYARLGNVAMRLQNVTIQSLLYQECDYMYNSDRAPWMASLCPCERTPLCLSHRTTLQREVSSEREISSELVKHIFDTPRMCYWVETLLVVVVACFLQETRLVRRSSRVSIRNLRATCNVVASIRLSEWQASAILWRKSAVFKHRFVTLRDFLAILGPTWCHLEVEKVSSRETGKDPLLSKLVEVRIFTNHQCEVRRHLVMFGVVLWGS